MEKTAARLEYKSPHISELTLSVSAVLCESTPSFGDSGNPGSEPGFDEDFNF